MLNELKKLLPEFTITESGNSYEVRKQSIPGKVVHLPLVGMNDRNISDFTEQVKRNFGNDSV